MHELITKRKISKSYQNQLIHIIKAYYKSLDIIKKYYIVYINNITTLVLLCIVVIQVLETS